MINIQNSNTSLNSSVVGFRPSRLLAESQKTEQWAKETADWCIAHANIQDNPKILSLYDMYNGQRDNTQFDYITKTFGVDFPAKLKHVPLVRPKINRLVGEEQERGVDLQVISVDRDSVDEKKQHIFNYVVRRFIQLQRQEITEDEFRREENFLRRSFRTNKEIAVYHMLKEYIYTHRLHEVFSDSMLDKIITGMEIGRVKLNRVGEDPVVETFSPDQIYYAPNQTKWISDCDWAVRVNNLTSTEIMDFYGEEISKDDQDKIFNRRELYSKEAVKLGGGRTMDDLLTEPIDIHEHYSWDNDIFTVYEVEFKSIRKVPVHISKNKFNPENPFKKLLTEDQYESLPNNRKKDVKFYYTEDLWRLTRIGPDIHVRIGKVNIPERDQKKPSKVKLTFEGLTFSDKIKPFSLVKATWDIQMLYDIMHFHKENLIALSGTRGSIMDLAQMPDFGFGFGTEEGFMKNLQMFLYYKKMGVMMIDSGKLKPGMTFNQFGTYDDTVGNGLGVVIQIIDHLDRIAGDIINVNRQRVGLIESRDGKANTENAIHQSALGTEPIFNEHDDFKDRILTKVANLSRLSYAKGGKGGAYVDKNFDQHIYTLEPEHTIGDFNIFVTNRANTKRTVEELKIAAQRYAQEGRIPFQDSIDILTTGSLQEIQTILKERIADTEQRIAAQQEEALQVEQQIEGAKVENERVKLQAELEQMRAEIEISKAELELKRAEVANEIDFKNGQLVLDQKRVDLESLQLQHSDNAKEVRND